MPDYDFKALKSEGIMQEKDGGYVTVRLRVLGGHVDAGMLGQLSDIAEQFGRGHIHLTTRQGIEIPHVAVGEIEELKKVLGGAGIDLGAAGPRVRTIVACQGGSCRFGRIDSQALAVKLDKEIRDYQGLPHKFKIAITGCPHSCAKPQENDFGIMGMGDGLYKCFVGGRIGKLPRWADVLEARVEGEDSLIAILREVMGWYSMHGRVKERLAVTLERLGGVDVLLNVLREKGLLRAG